MVINLKILHIYPTFDNKYGGVEKYLYNLSTQQEKNGHIVTLMSHNSIINIYNDNIIKTKFTMQNFIKFIILTKYDVLHTHGFRVPFSVLIGILKKLMGEKVVMTVHTIFPHRNTIDRIKKYIYDLTIGNLSLLLFDAFICINYDLVDQLIQKGVKKSQIYLIPNSILIEAPTKNIDKSLIYDILKIDKNKKIILMVGRIDWQKGYTSAIKTFNRLCNIRDDVLLLIVGRDYGYKYQLSKLIDSFGIGSNIVFTGEISNDLLFSAYSNSKILMLTSVYEGFPTVILEALLFGVPIVSTRVKGTNGLLNFGEGVYWVDNIKEMSDIINVLLNDDQLYNSLMEKGIKKVKSDFNWSINALKIIKIYGELLR